MNPVIREAKENDSKASMPLMKELGYTLDIEKLLNNILEIIKRDGVVFIAEANNQIVGCEAKSDAHKVLELLKERFNSFSLSLHPEKTKLVAFGKPAKSVVVNKITGTFNFLGFTFYWSKARKGYWVIRKKTINKRLSRFLKRIWE